MRRDRKASFGSIENITGSLETSYAWLSSGMKLAADSICVGVQRLWLLPTASLTMRFMKRNGVSSIPKTSTICA
jgi:hypothetical protein